jgi:hypothetical protein
MWSLFSLVVDLFTGFNGYREEKRRGLWNWAKFLAVLAFAALEASLILLPMLLPFASRFFLPTFLTCTAVALANFAWFLPVLRRWKSVVVKRSK